MKRLIFIFMLAAGVLCGCSADIKVNGQLDESPAIFPDYKDVTIPSNIAPLNFEVMEEGEWALIMESSGNKDVLKADYGLFSFGKRFWKSLLKENRGQTMTFTLCHKVDGKWLACPPFVINVAEEEIDPYLVYRLIPPLYSMWKEMGIYQRNLENFDETCIYNNMQGQGNCVNCHSFRAGDPDDMLLHMRVDLAGTYLFKDGKQEKLNTKTDSTISALVYPYWHPSGKYAAFSVNTTNEVFHTKNPNVVEVFDEASDVVVYDVDGHEVIASDVLGRADSFETFPVFSPDGRSLYFCSAKAVNPMPERFREVKYSLCRIDFNPDECSFGAKVDTLYSAITGGRSVSFPRVSPDGRYLAYVLSDFGNFSLWHKESDLYCVDLQDGTTSKMDALNSDDAESYHSWGSNSRWLTFSSRRDDGLYTKPYFSYIDKDGKAHKPFLLPQKNPKEFYDMRMVAYNIPELVRGKVNLGGRSVAELAHDGKVINVGYKKK